MAHFIQHLMDFSIEVLGFLIGTVLVKGIVAHYLSDMLLKVIKKSLIKTKDDLELYWHYRGRAKIVIHSQPDQNNHLLNEVLRQDPPKSRRKILGFVKPVE